MDSQRYCLTWNNHQNNFSHAIANFWLSQGLTDCLLACEGQCIKAHKIILAACSSYFEDIMAQFGSEKDPIIILRETSYSDLCAILEFMYYGEVRVLQSDLQSVLATAESLQIKGLAEVSKNSEKLGAPPTTSSSCQTGEKEAGSPDSDEIGLVVDEAQELEEIEDEEITSHVLVRPNLNNGETRGADVLTPCVTFSEGTSSGAASDHESSNPLSITFDNTIGVEGSSSGLTEEDTDLLNQVVKLDQYLNIPGKSRSQFWEEPWCRRVMELISRNALDIKNAAELIGVSYATLYAKYRESYGYRKHPYLGRVKVARPVGNPGVRAPRRRNSIDWGNENVQRICKLISSRDISIKKGAEMLGIDYSTLYYHLVRNSPAKAAR